MKHKGIENPEELYLEDIELRQKIMEYVKENV
jgi:hypothetical protein